jgi:hypothetical protein
MMLTEAPIEDVLAMQRSDLERRQKHQALQAQALHRLGHCADFDKNDMY